MQVLHVPNFPREDLVDGLERAPEAFIGLLEGHNFGKLIVRVDA